MLIQDKYRIVSNRILEYCLVVIGSYQVRSACVFSREEEEEEEERDTHATLKHPNHPYHPNHPNHPIHPTQARGMGVSRRGLHVLSHHGQGYLSLSYVGVF